MRYCSQAHPHEHTHQPLSQEKVTVWCAIGRNGIVGPYFFEDESGNRVTVDTDRYIALMRNKFIPALRKKRGVDMNSVIHHQDGAPPIVQKDLWNTYADIFLVIDSFQDALIYPGHHILLILTHLTTFSGGYLKERIYNNNPKTLADLKDNIKSEIMKIPVDMIERVIDNFNTRVGAVNRKQGAWIEHIINY